GLFAELRTARAELARFVAEPVPTRARGWNSRLRALEKRKEEIESRLASKASSFRASRTIDADAVRKALPDGVVLVDLLEYVHYHPPAGKVAEWRPESRLLAFVLRKAAEPVLLELGAAEPVSRAAAVWRQSLGGSREARKAARDLRDRVWLPI